MSGHVTQASGLSYAAIGSYAEQVGEHYAVFRGSDSADIDDLVRQLGGRCEIADGPESLHVRGKGAFTIFIPTSTSMRRDRFTKAHELGHYFLHYLLPKSGGESHFSRGGRNQAETEANVFASALLMPAERFRAVWEREGGHILKVAHAFDVSPAAASVRAQVLRLV